MDAFYDALYILQNLLATEVEPARCGDVVRAYHHEHFLGLARDITLEIVALLGRVCARVASVNNGQIVAVRCLESLGPAMHVGNTVAYEYNASILGSKYLERVVTVIAERLIGKCDCCQ